MFKYGLRLSICSGARMFWGLEHKAYLAELAQYDDILLDQQNGQVERFRVAPRRFCGKERSCHGMVVATVE